MPISKFLIPYPVLHPWKLPCGFPWKLNDSTSRPFWSQTSAGCEGDLLREEAAARAMNELRGLDGPDQPDPVPPPTPSAPLKCRAGQLLGCVWPWVPSLHLILSLTGFPPWTWTCLIIMAGTGYCPQACPACPAQGHEDWALAGEGAAMLALLSHSVAGSLFLGDRLTPTAPWQISFHSSSVLSLRKQASVSIPHLIFCLFLLSRPALSHPVTSTRPLTCWGTVSLLLSTLGCVNHGLAFQWYEGIREDLAVGGWEHSCQIDGKPQDNCQGCITPHAILLSSTRHFSSSPLSS